MCPSVPTYAVSSVILPANSEHLAHENRNRSYSYTHKMAGNPLNLDIKPTAGTTEEKLFNLVQTYLSSTNSTFPPLQAAKSINSLHPKHRGDGETSKESADNFFWTFWLLMFRIACQIDCMGEAMERFVSLVKALDKLPSTAEEEGGKVWQDLPVMGTCELKFWEGKTPHSNFLPLHYFHSC